MRAIVIGIIAVLGAASAWASAPVGPGKVFVGLDGERVTVLPLTPAESQKALLLVEGTGGEFDGMLLPHVISDQGRGNSYTTQWRGRDYTTFSVRPRGNRRAHYISVPGRRDSIEVSYNDARSLALEPEALYARHLKQKADGSLERIMAFHRKEEVAEQEQSFSESVASLNEKCGTSVTATIDWRTIPDERLKSYSISSFCANPLWALGELCGSDVARKAIQAQVSQVACQFGEAVKLELGEGRLAWTTHEDTPNQQQLASRLLMERLEPVGGKGESLELWMQREKTAVCTDGKGHYVVVAPSGTEGGSLSYGDGTRFVQVPPPPRSLPDNYFLEPRFFAKRMNPSFRGLDMRVYSEVEADLEKKTCSVRCGERTVDFELLDGDAVQALLRKATFERNPREFEPYALLRDTRGRYYLVDRGFHPEDQKIFRVFVGPKGNLRQQQMLDIVSDSEGMIFSTKKGELRLVLNREISSMWIASEKKLELRVVPVEQNLPLIYNELGVYTGVRLGTPCDDQ